MKKCIAFVAGLFLFGFAASAQTSQGTMLLGGNVSFQASDGQNVLNVNPMFGVFAFDKLAMGASFNLMSTEGSSNWSIGPFIRPYFFGTESGRMFMQAQLLAGGGNGRDTKFGYSAGIGYAHFLNRSVALEFSGIYSKVGDYKGVFTLGAGFQIHLRK